MFKRFPTFKEKFGKIYNKIKKAEFKHIGLVSYIKKEYKATLFYLVETSIFEVLDILSIAQNIQDFKYKTLQVSKIRAKFRQEFYCTYCQFQFTFALKFW